MEEIIKQIYEIDDNATEKEQLFIIKELLFLLIEKLEYNEPLNEKEKAELKKLKNCCNCIELIYKKME